ncbi:LGFP repeat protein OS=Tsukamurella paurometabola (strain ATCC 8368 / DSM / CCUG 35730 / CIP 100753 / JCM 10117 / KCTC 9821 / NBRC 16120 / NCIMB 702349/ NCTC 13040) OX=521096 GN=Tpau_2269 PE=4 SV=1 [Tsukamurella paurometabola]|uniref:LGFP repeat protein n=1 Tax=Tsukamurella paurometabola (strain ATCC 8368 / DSM 20162 / CCUG 35730 / CIP 100753 / JCM 10117 / KCTC 9821 / NBRC 16120 / NCIMB 702349 / NCTC 13040) TaxID=521096 RepID=D5UQA7_TSUPD|nr:LGFP repeat-containing protein [Tsukamurella paurometabola]ADG78877.1 LGFP repeat protein [Tsukamurella paurometabola DSM 20162]SUP33399.1 LGFP repeat [Tsukamurella paurometabola]
MNSKTTRTLGAVVAAAALTVSLTACNSSKDDSSGDAASSTAAAPSSAAGSGGTGTGASESAPVVPSTSIAAADDGQQVTITDAPIIAEYAQYGYEKGHLGAPLGPVAELPDGKGKFLTLKGGTIYWSEASGAHVVHGVIGDKWGAQGHESGKLGYPTSDEKSEDGAIKQTFQNGTITFKDGVATVS